MQTDTRTEANWFYNPYPMLYAIANRQIIINGNLCMSPVIENYHEVAINVCHTVLSLTKTSTQQCRHGLDWDGHVPCPLHFCHGAFLKLMQIR